MRVWDTSSQSFFYKVSHRSHLRFHFLDRSFREAVGSTLPTTGRLNQRLHGDVTNLCYRYCCAHMRHHWRLTVAPHDDPWVTSKAQLLGQHASVPLRVAFLLTQVPEDPTVPAAPTTKYWRARPYAVWRRTLFIHWVLEVLRPQVPVIDSHNWKTFLSFVSQDMGVCPSSSCHARSAPTAIWLVRQLVLCDLRRRRLYRPPSPTDQDWSLLGLMGKISSINIATNFSTLFSYCGLLPAISFSSSSLDSVTNFFSSYLYIGPHLDVWRAQGAYWQRLLPSERAHLLLSRFPPRRVRS